MDQPVQTHINHIALWTADLERARAFYTRHFAATAGDIYHNPRNQFSSYFLTFAAGARLELMTRPGLAAPQADAAGYAHLAFSLGSAAAVDTMTARLFAAGVPVLDGPRRTGDGYYESVVADPDGNRIELTI